MANLIRPAAPVGLDEDEQLGLVLRGVLVRLLADRDRLFRVAVCDLVAELQFAEVGFVGEELLALANHRLRSWVTDRVVALDQAPDGLRVLPLPLAGGVVLADRLVELAGGLLRLPEKEPTLAELLPPDGQGGRLADGGVDVARNQRVLCLQRDALSAIGVLAVTSLAR